YVPYSGHGSCPRSRRQALADTRAARLASSRSESAFRNRCSSSGERCLMTAFSSTVACFIFPIGLTFRTPHSTARESAARSARRSQALAPLWHVVAALRREHRRETPRRRDQASPIGGWAAARAMSERRTVEREARIRAPLNRGNL